MGPPGPRWISGLANRDAVGVGSDLGTIFDEEPELYDRARPGYPTGLLRDLVALADIGPGTRVVEIGPGTGQATGALAAVGADVVAVEPGAGLATVLKRKLADAKIEVVVSAFEAWPAPIEPFDVLVAFTAWHWLDPAVRMEKAAAALRPSGMLATVSTVHVAGGTEEFFVDVQECYERWDPSTPPGLRLPRPESIPAAVDELDDHVRFEPALRRRFQQDVVYSTRGYLELLATYSGHRALPPTRRDALFACIGELVDRRYGGTIVKRYLYELRLARRRPDS